MPRDLILIGGGEHARVVADAALSRPKIWNVIGFVDPRPCPDTTAGLGLHQFADDDEALARAGEAWFVMGIGRLGSVALRRRLVALYSAAGARWASVIHAGAIVSRNAILCEGVVIFAGAIVNTGAVLGAHSVANTSVVIEHDVKLGEFTIAAPGVVVGGGAQIEEDCYLGLGSRVRDHICVGRGTTVGMGAVVVQTLPAGVQVFGVPARVRKKL
jgi:acetyltransferase EpsM